MIISRRALIAAGIGVLAAESLARIGSGFAAFAEARKLRVASVKFGTLAWLLETIKAEKLDEKYNVALEIIETATNQSSPVALYGGSADVVVTDWPWAFAPARHGRGGQVCALLRRARCRRRAGRQPDQEVCRSQGQKVWRRRFLHRQELAAVARPREKGTRSRLGRSRSAPVWRSPAAHRTAEGWPAGCGP